MMRTFAILVLLAAGLPRLGVGVAAGQEQCGESACHKPVVQMSLCDCDSCDGDFCPMSKGPCECITAPAPDSDPKPEAPLPRSDRDTVTGMPNGSPQVTVAAEPDATMSRLASLVLGLSADKTHNEIQAPLGIWRT